MRRLLWSFLSAAAILAAAPPAAVGAEPSNRHPSTAPEGDELGWILVSDGITSMSDMGDLESIDEFRTRYGPSFLLLREGNARYLIRDKKLIERAEQASYSIKVYGKEIGLLARSRVRDAIGSKKSSRKIAALAQGGRRRSNTPLDRDVRELVRDLEALGDDPRPTDTPRSRELDRRIEAVSKQLDEAVREGQEEMRLILKEAKARNLVKRID